MVLGTTTLQERKRGRETTYGSIHCDSKNRLKEGEGGIRSDIHLT